MLRLPSLALLACIALALAPPASAAPGCEAHVAITAPGLPPFIDTQTTEAGCTMSAQVGPATMTSDGEADWGIARARTDATYLAGETDQATSYAQAGWRDMVTLDSAGHDGETAQVQALVHFSGFIDVTGSASAGVLLQFRSQAGFQNLKQVECFGGSPSCDFQVPPRIYDEIIPVTFPLVVGEESVLSLEVTTDAGRNPISTDPGTADIDFTSTARWGGIEEVTIGGNPVTFTLASESGTDWVQPVPEPGAAALLAAGAAVLASTRLRRASPESAAK